MLNGVTTSPPSQGRTSLPLRKELRHGHVLAGLPAQQTQMNVGAPRTWSSTKISHTAHG